METKPGQWKWAEQPEPQMESRENGCPENNSSLPSLSLMTMLLHLFLLLATYRTSKNTFGTGEIAHGLRALIVLSEDPRSEPQHPHRVAYNGLELQFQGI